MNKIKNIYFKNYILINQTECQEDGMKLHKSDAGEGGGITYGVPEFKFNNKLNTCLYKSVYYDERFFTNFIKNVYTNETLVEWNNLYMGDGKFQDLRGSKEEWDLKVKELFGN